LMPHQLKALDFALDRRTSYLALDMGLGKTATSIAIIAESIVRGKAPALIVVPPSLRLTWVKEFAKFAPSISVEVLRGRATRPLPPADVYIIGDSTVGDWSDPLDPNTLVGKIQTLIVDEAHRVKSPKAGRTQGVIRIANSISDGYKVLLSGTPTPNGRNYEMGSQIDVLGDDAWLAVGGKGKFYTYYCPIERDDKGKLNRFGKRTNNDSLGLNKCMTDSFMMRMKRGEVLDLPNKGRNAVHVEGLGKAVKDYLKAEQSLIEYLAGEGRDWKAAARNEALVRLTIMRKLAGECKVKGIILHVRELFESSLADGEGVFLVAEHHDVMFKLREGLAKYGVVAVNGMMDDKEKDESVRLFNSGKARVLVGQVKSAGVGLTLHGDGRNHHAIICQLPWSPSDLTQAEDRLHRIGQINDVNVEICLASIDGSWTIDERLWSLLEQKAFSSGEIIDGKGEFLLEDIQDSIIDSYR
jgi:SWI/SNF-related matrix-associated actin-dependent regulator 1 of chromatin subfamily A